MLNKSKIAKVFVLFLLLGFAYPQNIHGQIKKLSHFPQSGLESNEAWKKLNQYVGQYVVVQLRDDKSGILSGPVGTIKSWFPDFLVITDEKTDVAIIKGQIKYIDLMVKNKKLDLFRKKVEDAAEKGQFINDVPNLAVGVALLPIAAASKGIGAAVGVFIGLGTILNPKNYYLDCKRIRIYQNANK